MSIEEDMATLLYVDYGDKRKINVDKLLQLDTEFISLRFQAMEATLNLTSVPLSISLYQYKIIIYH